jgi:hypothetical protein
VCTPNRIIRLSDSRTIKWGFHLFLPFKRPATKYLLTYISFRYRHISDRYIQRSLNEGKEEQICDHGHPEYG